MSRIVDWKVWSDYNKYTKQSTLKGVAKVDAFNESSDDLEALVQQANKLNKQRWDKVVAKLECNDYHGVPRKIASQLQEWLAGDLREIYGRNKADASYEQPLRSIDMIKAADKIGVVPGESGWEEKVLNAISAGEVRS